MTRKRLILRRKLTPPNPVKAFTDAVEAAGKAAPPNPSEMRPNTSWRDGGGFVGVGEVGTLRILPDEVPAILSPPGTVVHTSRASRDGHTLVVRYVLAAFGTLEIGDEFRFTTSGMSYSKTGPRSAAAHSGRGTTLPDATIQVYVPTYTREPI